MSFYLGIQKTKNKTSWEKINTLCTYTDHLHAMTQVTQSPDQALCTSSNRNMANKMNFLSYANSTT